MTLGGDYFLMLSPGAASEGFGFVKMPLGPFGNFLIEEFSLRGVNVIESLGLISIFMPEEPTSILPTLSGFKDIMVLI